MDWALITGLGDFMLNKEETLNSVSGDSVDILESEGTDESGIEGKRKKLKELFEVDPKAKREYAAKASKRTREKKKQQKIWLTGRNKFLESEQMILKTRVDGLKAELDRLEAASRSSNGSDALLNVENQLLKREVKRRRTVIQRIRDVITAVPEENEENLLSLAKLGAQGAVSNLLNICYASVENRDKSWFTLVEDFTSDPMVSQSPYFSKCDQIKARYECVKKKLHGCDSPVFQANLRIDCSGFDIDESTMAKALWRFEKRQDKWNAFSMISEYLKFEDGLDLQFSNIDIDLASLSLNDVVESPTSSPNLSKPGCKRKQSSDGACREWLLPDGTTRILLNTYLDNTPPASAEERKNPPGGKMVIVSSARSKVSRLGLDTYSNDYSKIDTNEYSEAFVVTNSVSSAFSAKERAFFDGVRKNQPNASPKPEAEAVVDDDVKEYADNSFSIGCIVHNFDNKENHCNITLVASVLEGSEDPVYSSLYRHLTMFKSFAGTNFSFINAEIAPFFALLIKGISHSLEEVAPGAEIKIETGKKE